ncbi:AraC family transcriptional regulator [Sinomicrobium soli]|uniref:AraC family transcriptional regulator n=1 Tax=Sinomicrobium sp. N-1-3-6 TaxID=2219864 RepID=UPI000DCBAFBB|nr:AraC family transcriptional regulator [Sinomicrobium sp. N-1-3-6]RAV30013.1 AraC family transcriptional regulator [Sinomicrobium sp. N-1-3-6]
MENDLSKSRRIKEGFIGQKMYVVPRNIRQVITGNPLINSLYFTDVGYYPHATHHYRERKRDCEEYILIYCIEGEGVVRMKSGEHILGPGSYFIIPRNTAHSYGSSTDNYWSIYWVHFTGDRARVFYERYKQNSGETAVSIPLEKKRIDLFNTIFSFLESGYSISNVEYLNVVLWELLGSFVYHELYSTAGPNEELNRMDRSIRYMKENLDKPLRIEEIANHFSFSVSHYFTVFKKRTGYSPLQYFNQMKIQAACQYLTFTRLSVKEISFRIGFEDPLYFSRIFKKVMDLSPLQYRNTYSQEMRNRK